MCMVQRSTRFALGVCIIKKKDCRKDALFKRLQERCLMLDLHYKIPFMEVKGYRIELGQSTSPFLMKPVYFYYLKHLCLKRCLCQNF